MYEMSNKADLTNIFESYNLTNEDFFDFIPARQNDKIILYYIGNKSIDDYDDNHFKIKKIDFNNYHSIVDDPDIGVVGNLYNDGTIEEDTCAVVINNTIYHIPINLLINTVKQYFENNLNYTLNDNELIIFNNLTNIITIMRINNDYYYPSYLKVVNYNGELTLDIVYIQDFYYLNALCNVSDFITHRVIDNFALFIYKSGENSITIERRALFGTYRIDKFNNIRSVGNYYKITNNGDIYSFNNKTNSIELINLNGGENGKLELIELPKIDNEIASNENVLNGSGDYQLLISDSGIAFYKSNHRYFILDTKYSTINNLKNDSGYLGLELFEPIADNGMDSIIINNKLHKHIQNKSIKIKYKNNMAVLGEFLNEDGHFASDQYFDFYYDENENIIKSMIFTDANNLSNILTYDLTNMRYHLSNYNGEEILHKKVMLKPSSKYEIFVIDGTLTNPTFTFEFVKSNDDGTYSIIHTYSKSYDMLYMIDDSIDIDINFALDVSGKEHSVKDLLDADYCLFSVDSDTDSEFKLEVI